MCQALLCELSMSKDDQQVEAILTHYLAGYKMEWSYSSLILPLKRCQTLWPNMLAVHQAFQ